MIKATMNQLTNINNQFQTNKYRVLVCCSAGMLRSPTLSNVLHQEFGFNTRACGLAKEYALIPISEALIHWCDELIFVDEYCQVYLDQDELEEIKLAGCFTTTLDIPDQYCWNDEKLRVECLRQYNDSHKNRGMEDFR